MWTRSPGRTAKVVATNSDWTIFLKNQLALGGLGQSLSVPSQWRLTELDNAQRIAPDPLMVRQTHNPLADSGRGCYLWSRQLIGRLPKKAGFRVHFGLPALCGSNQASVNSAAVPGV